MRPDRLQRPKGMVGAGAPLYACHMQLDLQNTLVPPVPEPLDRARRRCLLQAAGWLVAASTMPANAQPVSALAEEARAPALPALGSLLEVPAIELLAGGRFEPVQAQGRPLLVYWWSSTCPFCALQSPHMDQLWRQQQARGWQMLALSIDRQPQDALTYLQKKGYSFPAAWASPAWRQAFPKPRGLPITLLRGRDGRLLLAEKGQMFPEDVAAMAALI